RHTRSKRDWSSDVCSSDLPSGEAIILATTIIAAGAYNTWSVTTLPTVEPIEEINVIARLEAMVTRVGIFKITSMIGTKINAPARSEERRVGKECEIRLCER